VALVAALMTMSAAAQPGQSHDRSRHVVLISLDGFPGWALDDPYLPVPTLRRLAASGAIGIAMRPVNPTVT
jgi:hypothetical protein